MKMPGPQYPLSEKKHLILIKRTTSQPSDLRHLASIVVEI